MPNDSATSMLYFYCAGEDEVGSVHDVGLSSADGPLQLFDSLAVAEEHCTRRILVVDAFALDSREVFEIAPDALRNVDPYLPPETVTAAGGFVMRRVAGDLELVLIYRRGRWDLPKGKLDKGESIEDCAVREVREELGVDEVRLGRSLGSTVHGYADGSSYKVKTTYWYEMTTTADEFQPEKGEGIEIARWMRWDDAREHLGYETLRRHMDRVLGIVA